MVAAEGGEEGGGPSRVGHVFVEGTRVSQVCAMCMAHQLGKKGQTHRRVSSP